MVHASNVQMPREIQSVYMKLSKIYHSTKIHATLYIWHIALVQIYVIFILHVHEL